MYVHVYQRFNFFADSLQIQDVFSSFHSSILMEKTSTKGEENEEH
jgi:hypothetical protein